MSSSPPPLPLPSSDPVDELTSFVAADYDASLRVLALSCGDVRDAEDALQEACVRCLIQLRRGASIESVQAWVIRVAFNRIRDGWRHRLMARRYAPLLDPGSEHDHGQLTATAMDTLAAIKTLPRRQREAVVLYYYGGFDVGLIAELLGVGAGTVKTALSRARSSLDRELNSDRESVFEGERDEQIV